METAIVNYNVQEVDFEGAKLMAAQDQAGQVWVGVSWICNGLGLNKHQKDRQIMNIQADEVVKRGCLKFEAGVLDPNNEVIALDLNFLPLWLAKISITPAMKRDNPELVARLVEYQLKAKDVLAAAFIYKNSQVVPYTKEQIQAIIHHELISTYKNFGEQIVKCFQLLNRQVMDRCDGLENSLSYNMERLIKMSLNNPALTSAKPDKLEPYNQIWIENQQDKISQLLKLMKLTKHHFTKVLTQIYRKMTKEYSFVIAQEKKEYNETHGNYPTSVLKMISSSEMWRSVFESILDDMIGSLKYPQPETEVVESEEKQLL